MSNLSIVSIEEESHIILGTDTEVKRDRLETRYTKLIEGLVSDITGSKYKATFVSSQDNGKDNTILPKPSAFGFLLREVTTNMTKNMKSICKVKA